MNIKIIKIIDAGTGNQERLFMKAVARDNVGMYVVFDTVQVEPGKVSSTPRNVYWFPDIYVNAGDSIVLYTKAGTQSQIKNADGTTTFFFYWGRTKTLWSKQVDAAVLMRIDGWEYKTVL